MEYTIAWGSRGSAEVIFVGKIKIAGFYYNAMRKRSDPLCYKAVSYVPGLKNVLGNVETEQEARVLVEKAVDVFIRLLQSKEYADG